MSDQTNNPKTLHSRILSGSIVLLSGSSLTTAINLLYNIAVARYLGPNGFGHATVVYTILTLISAVTLSFQIITAKVVAQQNNPQQKGAAYRGFHGSAWTCGIFVALILLLYRVPIANYLSLPDPFLVSTLAVGAAFYVPLGTRRGYIQGLYGFSRLAINLVIEGMIRLTGSYLLIMAGFGVRGVIAANSVAIAVAYFIAAEPQLPIRVSSPISTSYAIRETFQAFVFYSSQVMINNSDIVLVEHFFPARLAGLYAAVAMVGRVIFAFSSAVVNSTFPLVAGNPAAREKSPNVLGTPLLLVLGIGSILSFGLWIAPASLWKVMFGSGFDIVGKYNIPYLITLYAITTVVYSLSNVIITFTMSYKIAYISWVQLVFSGMLIAGICLFHSSLRIVIMVQLVLMSALLAVIAMLLLVDFVKDWEKSPHVCAFHPVKVIRRMCEDEVIAEFLKSDFHNPTFQKYQDVLRDIVMVPDINDPSENEKRRALLFLRHRSLWKEIPVQTEWCEVEVTEANLDRIRVFPRAQWLKLARGNFSIIRVSERMRARPRATGNLFMKKIANIEDVLIKEDLGLGSVILIGLNEDEPLTVLDGNHRIVAATLASRNSLKKLRFIRGLSPRMTECCWYNTNIANLFRYARNLLSQARRNPVDELEQKLQNA